MEDDIPFETLAQYVGASDAFRATSKRTQLQFYALYKAFNQGPAPQVDVFRRLYMYFIEPTEYAKWAAWDLASWRYRTSAEVRSRYCVLAKSIGAFPTDAQLAIMRLSGTKPAGRGSSLAKEVAITEAPLELDALIDACEKDDEETIRLFASGQGNINIKTAEGTTLLHFAVDYKAMRVLKLLLTMPSVDIDAQDDQGQTALHLAAINGAAWQELGRLLVTQGKADMSIKDHEGQSPEDILVDEGIDVSTWQ
ncbi:ankyrin repeat-containing domain protein [Protomyces lactucae-debilis]|uniref:Ankyrin repeat-containing domain protein n=1 Tax=Protomyces lactucae-debilis TaxID=2754530 RepID=A0A1Y2F9K5_PROLT|nr:ankyrin repeat-containing domain protein [Protomyces lactucae-debilis]ORY80006.1 ankyrin repeat-containing domain protein [Protomyces lactucae-debilis]